MYRYILIERKKLSAHDSYFGYCAPLSSLLSAMGLAPKNRSNASVTKSFADVGITNSPAAIPLKQPGTYRGELAMFFSEEENAVLSSPFKFTMIGKFSHGRPALSEIRATFETIGLKSAYNTGLDYKHILIRFSHEDDFHGVWLLEQWYLKKFPNARL